MTITHLYEESDPNDHDGTLDALHDTYSAIGSKVGINVSHPEGCHHRIEFQAASGDQAANMVASHLIDHGAKGEWYGEPLKVAHYGPDHKIIHFYDGNAPAYARVQKQGDKYSAEFCR